MCRPEEWASIPEEFDNMWGIIKESGESLAFISVITLFPSLTLCFSCFSASVHLDITDEQEDFWGKVRANPLEERKWKDLLTLDTLHAFCGGLEPTPVAR